MSTNAHWLKLGRISGVHGVRGWVKIQSYTQPPQQIVEYQPWRITLGDKSESAEIDAFRHSGKSVIAHIIGIDDRDKALALRQADIFVRAEQMPSLEKGEFYWYQLEGLKVTCHFQGHVYDLGRVDYLLETGANDVLVVKGNPHIGEGMDDKERLIPYLPGQTITQVDLESREIRVNWDPDF